MQKKLLRTEEGLPLPSQSGQKMDPLFVVGPSGSFEVVGSGSEPESTADTGLLRCFFEAMGCRGAKTTTFPPKRWVLSGTEAANAKDDA